jgi:dipeptidyl aminopeptidase/acylaminoacyl peptidase
MKRLEEYEILKFTPQEPVSDPQVSPDGETIAFTYSEVNYEDTRAGYMTNWIVGQTDRFKASIVMRNITNWITMSGNSCVAFDPGYPQHDISGGKPCGMILSISGI